ncbi:MAG TPA: DUF4197 domain-containing protein [Thiobacillaceae bacterium]|nr:DUF4197 domain-containing protein [Thiobacillaceae bacterium]
MKKLLVGLLALGFTVSASAFDFGALQDKLKGVLNKDSGTSQSSTTQSAIDKLTPAEINGGLKEALSKGAEAAVAQLGKENGFWSDPNLRIPLPDNLKKVSKLMKTLGMGKQVDALELGMNRAAEAAVPEAKGMLVGAVKSMTVDDAKGILTGGDTAATDFFRKKTEGQLTEKFLPIVKGTTDKVGLAQTYNTYAGTAARFGAIKADQASIENYVTKEGLDRLYKVIGEKEKAFRANPLQSGSELIKKVFGAVLGK